MPRYTVEDVISVLNDLDWKTVLQMMDEMADAKGLPKDSWRRPFAGPGVSWMYSQLGRLVQQELVQWRYGTDEGTIKQRGDRQYKEYRLSSTGLRRKDEIIERNRNKQRVGDLAPRPT